LVLSLVSCHLSVVQGEPLEVGVALNN